MAEKEKPKLSIDDVRHALLTKLRAKECDGWAALAIADWLKASLEDEDNPRRLAGPGASGGRS